MQTPRFRLRTLLLAVGLVGLGLALARALSRLPTVQLNWLVPSLLGASYAVMVLVLLHGERRRRRAEGRAPVAPDGPTPGDRP